LSFLSKVRPLISLIVPVWGDDDLVVDLVNSLPVAPELAEMVVVAVSFPGPTDECRRHCSTWHFALLSSL
jgi:hypothetical protein